jgi:uncharacterized protein DUF5916/cellulose/xylan binding protein with CBM9 domain
MIRRLFLVSARAMVCVLAGPLAVWGQPAGHAPHSSVSALRVARPPVIDGRLNDSVYADAEPATAFTQQDPDEGQAATERTELRILYDDEALYIAARMFDSDAALIAQRLSSRDGDADADMLEIYLDPMHDHLTGANFRVSASGVQRDSTVFNDSWTDSTWDAVWDSAVSIDDGGWSAELRIPLSQLRFAFAERQTWGVNAMRFIRRKNERDWLELVRKNESGLASRMAHLTGLDGLRPKRHLALLPYTATRAEFIAPGETGNPFNDGSRGFAAAGLDLKWGVTSNLTLDGTMNPDFGQVEVDPAVVNLSAFETFFEEKRPFFLEGAQIFGNFGRGGSNNFWGFNSSDPSLFYSRRIGRAPQVSPSGDFTDAPPATTILGAVKLTGKTRNGWSIGLLNALTDRETARTVTSAVGGRAAVEPLTNYFVVRMQREIGRRAGAGMMATAVARRLDTAVLRDTLASSAFVAGGDAYWFLSAERDWVVTGKLAASHLTGTAAMIARAQRAPQRYFQRPDARHVLLDSTRTTLDGFNGRVNLNRNSGLLQVNAALWGVSPGFESNDLGFHGTGDRAGAHTVVMWRNVTPNRVTRSWNVWAAKWWTWNFSRDLQGDGWNSNAFITFRNYWTVSGGGNGSRRVQDDRLTRGGPSAALPARWNGFGNFSSDSRRLLSVSGGAGYLWTDANGTSMNANLSVNFKPSPTVTISTGPQWNDQSIIAQYVKSADDATATATYGGRYVFANLSQQQLSMTTRVNVIISPRVSIQVFAQPLLAVGDYTNFKELAAPRTFDFVSYGAAGSTLSYDALASTYEADPDGGGSAPAFTFRNPDFNFKSLRVNAVFRWELKPGSTFYAVWTRQQLDFERPGEFSFGRDASALFTAPGDDIVLFKIAYWIGR